MALSQRLEFRQSQALVMTPQLMQAIKLLQLSNLDLAAYVEDELERNPLLERTRGGGRRAPNRRARGRDTTPGRAADWSAGAGRDRADDATADAAAPPSTMFPRRCRCRVVALGCRVPGAAIPNGPAWVPAAARMATTISKPSSRPRRRWPSHLAEQLALAIADPVRRMIGQYLIDLVDEAGYLTGDLAQVADKLGAPAAEVEAVLAILQGFDPPGVCARATSPNASRSSCEERDRFDPAMQALVAISICWPSATLRPCAASAAWATKI